MISLDDFYGMASARAGKPNTALADRLYQNCPSSERGSLFKLAVNALRGRNARGVIAGLALMGVVMGYGNEAQAAAKVDIPYSVAIASATSAAPAITRRVKGEFVSVSMDSSVLAHTAEAWQQESRTRGNIITELSAYDVPTLAENAERFLAKGDLKHAYFFKAAEVEYHRGAGGITEEDDRTIAKWMHKAAPRVNKGSVSRDAIAMALRDSSPLVAYETASALRRAAEQGSERTRLTSKGQVFTLASLSKSTADFMNSSSGAKLVENTKMGVSPAQTLVNASSKLLADTVAFMLGGECADRGIAASVTIKTNGRLPNKMYKGQNRYGAIGQLFGPRTFVVNKNGNLAYNTGKHKDKEVGSLSK